jgi:hypothetical protein
VRSSWDVDKLATGEIRKSIDEVHEYFRASIRGANDISNLNGDPYDLDRY